jgi:hypothetical protein
MAAADQTFSRITFASPRTIKGSVSANCGHWRKKRVATLASGKPTASLVQANHAS